MKYKSFIFDSYEFDIDQKILKLKYSFDNKLNFTEEILFPSKKKLNNNEILALNNVFRYLHIIAGISYYKLFLPENIKINTFELSKEEAKFFNYFYINGLGEFSYRNNIIGLDKLINFPYKENIKNTSSTIKLNRKNAVPVGGGKDSIVSIELLKQLNEDIILCSVNTAKPIEDTIKIANLNYFQVERKISPNIFEINKDLEKYGAYNGHVPITGILAFILCACSIIYNFDTIFISNERSANIGNVEFDNRLINHQWSKSYDFEKNVNEFFKKFVLENFNYVSFLRPLSEYNIAKIFLKFDKYYNVFASCNKAYKINNKLETWCCNCDKCRFVFLILSNFLEKEKLTKIFGKDLLDDKKQLKGFKELVGLENFKPFECVGEIEESVCSILNINETFNNDYIVKEIKPILSKKHDAEKLKEKYLSLSNIHNLNDKYFSFLKNV